MANYFKLAQNHVQVRLKDLDGEFHMLKVNTGGQTTPNGSTDLSFNFELMVNETDRYCTITMEGFITVAEFDWMNNNIVTGTGTTGGTSLGLTAQLYTMDDFRCAKINAITVTNSVGAAVIGDMFGYQFKASTTGGDPDQRGLKIPQFVLYELTGKGRQMKPGEDLTAYKTDTNKDVTVSTEFLGGDTFTSTEAMSFIPKMIEHGSKGSHVEFSSKGRTPLRAAYTTFAPTTWTIVRTV